MIDLHVHYCMHAHMHMLPMSSIAVLCACMHTECGDDDHMLTISCMFATMCMRACKCIRVCRQHAMRAPIMMFYVEAI